MCLRPIPSILSLPQIPGVYLRNFPWKSLPQIFALPRWQSLRVRVKSLLETQLAIDDKDIKLLLELGDDGFDFGVIRDCKDWLQEYMKGQRTRHLRN
jgi:hypothetical protein